jgi:hypothetical protein
MTFHNGEMPRKSDRYIMTTLASQHYHSEHTARYDNFTMTRTNPWAVACYALAIIALFGAAVQTLVPFISGMLSILCGAVALATVLVERRLSGFWMALLGIASASIPLVLAALILFGR